MFTQTGMFNSILVLKLYGISAAFSTEVFKIKDFPLEEVDRSVLFHMLFLPVDAYKLQTLD